MSAGAETEAVLLPQEQNSTTQQHTKEEAVPLPVFLPPAAAAILSPSGTLRLHTVLLPGSSGRCVVLCCVCSLAQFHDLSPAELNRQQRTNTAPMTQ